MSKPKFYLSRYRKPTDKDEPFLVNLGGMWASMFRHDLPREDFIWMHAPVAPTVEQLILEHECVTGFYEALRAAARKIPSVQAIWASGESIYCGVPWKAPGGGVFYALTRQRVRVLRKCPFVELPEIEVLHLSEVECSQLANDVSSELIYCVEDIHEPK